MGLFRKKKKPQYVEEILEFGEEIDLRSKRRAEKAKKIQKARQSAAAEQSGNENQGQENKKSIATEYCEQIMDAARNLEETKREYKTVTDYLTDIQIIENLPEPEFEKIQETAQNVMNLNEARDAYLNRTKTISDAQFVQMEQLEYEMPEIIKRLQENEAYQNVVKRDMQYLEGEKQEWHYYQESLEQEKKLLHRLLYALIGLFAAAVAAIVILGLSMKFDIKMPFVAAALISGALGGMMVWRYQNDGMELKKAHANINRAIVLMNKVKFKYVNVTNAVDYACEKYHVKNSYELSYIWDQYLEAVKEREKYERTNDDLEYFNDKLVRQLHAYRLYDARIWIHQAKALMDKKEMVEVKHELLVRRQKLRAGMESQADNIRTARKEIENLVKNRPGGSKEIKAILDSVDEMCGIG
ncbi:MAG: hypothetical protein HFH50_14395 [Lachnospiraceae bacterium]|jgi:hypothetical protein|nr:hypothetical protein [Lachnospiraceae bacterium]MCI8873096.1 hypothetical protein [Lachnospiraceae bacterium]GFI31461.1 hypothetical protein IMSAGC013_02856 [Lachnospiraceae bacterium]